ncbi:MAG: hypothetical protein J7L47_00955 [Candidatus Odinarchaeota archaeon]|nr:hypothetical protein [Candidatus Odinarchaeota archaeon]
MIKLSVPPEIIKFFQSGSRLLVVKGNPGTGKTIFSLTVFKKLKELGFSGVYVTTRTWPEDLYADLPWIKDVIPPSAIIDATNPLLQQKQVVSRLDIIKTRFATATEFFGTILKIMEKKAQNIMLIDSWNTILEVVNQQEESLENLLHDAIKTMKINAIVIQERPTLSRLEFIADGVIALEDTPTGRKLIINKLRGIQRDIREYTFSLSNGMFRYYEPLLLAKIKGQDVSFEKRLSTGCKELDKMLEGGIPRGFTVLVSGPIGTGKTIIGLEYIYSGLKNGEAGLIISFEETPEQITQEARRIGFNFNKYKDLLTIIYLIPTKENIEEHIFNLRKIIDEQKPKRIFIDGVREYENIFTHKEELRVFLHKLVNFFRTKGITTMMSAEIPGIIGGELKITDKGISAIVDGIILLRFVEESSSIAKAIHILKMRGTNHDRGIRRYTIGRQGIKIGGRFKNLEGLMSGQPSRLTQKVEEFLE